MTNSASRTCSIIHFSDAVRGDPSFRGLIEAKETDCDQTFLFATLDRHHALLSSVTHSDIGERRTNSSLHS